jgi:pheromone shutdown protein TraB
MSSLKIFTWWFLVGSLMAAAVILIQGGIRDIMLTGEPLWEIKLIELITPIFGGGILGGCIALILNRIRKPDS